MRLGYLKSYTGMGQARLTCMGTCACSSVIDAHDNSSHVSVTAVARLSLSPCLNNTVGGIGHGCTLHVRVLEESHSGFHKFKVLSLLLGGKELKADSV